MNTTYLYKRVRQYSIEETLNSEAAEGWKLHSITPVVRNVPSASDLTEYVIVFFKEEVLSSYTKSVEQVA